MTVTVDPSPDRLAELARERNPAVVHAESVEVSTDVVLSSGAGVTVLLAGGHEGQTISVSDGGAAIRYVRELGLYLTGADVGSIKRTAKSLGFEFGVGELSLKVRPSDVAWAISLVANGSRDIAHAALRAVRRREAKTFKATVWQQLSRIFPTSIITDGPRIAGASLKPYRFDYSVRLSSGGNQLTLDLPHPEPATVSATVLRNLDVHQRKSRDIMQVIVWDDRDPWPAETLAQLGLAGVPVVRGSTPESALLDLVGPVAPSND